MRCADVPVQPEGEVGVVEPTDEHDAGKDRSAWAETPQHRAKAEEEDQGESKHAAERGADVPERRLAEVGGIE